MAAPFSYTYAFAVLGLPISVRARTLRLARLQALRRWLRSITVKSPHLPVAPPVFLVFSDDPRLLITDLFDARLYPSKHLRLLTDTRPPGK